MFIYLRRLTSKPDREWKRKILISSRFVNADSKQDPWSDKNFEYSFANERHDIHAISMDGHGYWMQIPRAATAKKGEKAEQGMVPQQTLKKYFDGRKKLLCCCQKENTNYDKNGIAK